MLNKSCDWDQYLFNGLPYSWINHLFTLWNVVYIKITSLLLAKVNFSWCVWMFRISTLIGIDSSISQKGRSIVKKREYFFTFNSSYKYSLRAYYEAGILHMMTIKWNFAVSNCSRFFFFLFPNWMWRYIAFRPIE